MAQFTLGPAASIRPDAARSIPQMWPPLTYPWAAYPWLVGGSGLVIIRRDRVCLGSECWNLRRLSLADASNIQRILLRRSWPLAEASLLAVALYQADYKLQARAVSRVYQGRHGVEAWNRQFERVYDARTGPFNVPTGVQTYPMSGTGYGP